MCFYGPPDITKETSFHVTLNRPNKHNSQISIMRFWKKINHHLIPILFKLFTLTSAHFCSNITVGNKCSHLSGNFLRIGSLIFSQTKLYVVWWHLRMCATELDFLGKRLLLQKSENRPKIEFF